jgi:hypothetical protein
MTPFTSASIPASQLHAAAHAELLFSGVEQGGPSFEGRVFLNNPDADESTPQTSEEGYAGSFHVYGYGEPAPPGIARARALRSERHQPIAPISKRLRPDEEALRTALGRSDELTITVVPVSVEPGAPVTERTFERVELVRHPAT